jgi:hypothetical protein
MEILLPLAAMAYLLVSTGLLVDRYFLLFDRFVGKMKRKTNATGKCVICERPMRVYSDEDFEFEIK